MKMIEIRKKAVEVRVNAQGMKKLELIRAIQTAEGNFPCFGTAPRDCDQPNCCWREDCLSLTA